MSDEKQPTELRDIGHAADDTDILVQDRRVGVSV